MLFNRFLRLGNYGAFVGQPLPADPSVANSGQGMNYFNSALGAWRFFDPLNNRWKSVGGSGENIFTIANNQSSAANVTGLLLDGTVQRSAFIFYSIYRNTTGGGATELSECGVLLATFKTVASSWEFVPLGSVGDAGVTLTITSGGQVQYTSSNITGTAATSKMSFFVMDLGV